MYLFWTVLGPHCCTQALSTQGEQGFSLQGLLLSWSSGAPGARGLQ